MEIKHQSIILDVNKANILPNILAHQGDQKTRFIDVTLTMSGEELILNDSYRAILKASNNGEVKAINDCQIDLESNVIIVELTNVMLDTAGFLNCEITVVDEDKYITSQSFLVEVTLSTVADEEEIKSSPEYGTLVKLMDEVSKIEEDAHIVKEMISNLSEIQDINTLVTSKADKETVEQELVKKANVADVENLKTTVSNLEENKANNSELEKKENISNKFNEIIFPSTNYYPTHKAVWNFVDNSLSPIQQQITDNKNLINTNSESIDSLNNLCNAQKIEYISLLPKVTTNIKSNFYLADSNNYSINNMTLYGNSIQSSVPTPTAPVDIVSVENSNIKFYRKNIFDFNICNTFVNGGAKISLVDKTNNIITFTTDENTNNSGVYILHTTSNGMKGYEIDYTKLLDKTVTLSFDVISNIDCQMLISFVTNNWNNYTSVTTEKQRIAITETIKDISQLNKAMTFYCMKASAEITISNIQIEVNNIATEYEECEYQKSTTECTLRGISTINDTLTINSDGTGYITQNLLYERIKSGKSSSGQSWQFSTTSGRFHRDDKRYQANFGTPKLMCSHFEVKDNGMDTTLDNTIGFTAGNGKGIAIRMTEQNGDVSAFESWLDENEVYVLVPLEEPIITELTKEEVDKFLSLHSYYPTTTVVSDTDVQITYIADIKNYIDNKIS